MARGWRWPRGFVTECWLQNKTSEPAGLTLVQMGRILNLPELINNQWVRRYDISVDLPAKSPASTAFNRWSTRQFNFWRLKHGTGLTCFRR
jgi:hypothetical protein